MQPRRSFEIPFVFSSLTQSFLIVLLFAGSLSTVSTTTTIEKPEEANAAVTPPKLFPEKEAVPFSNATLHKNENLTRLIGNNSEAINMLNSSVSKKNATVDTDESDSSMEGIPTTEAPIVSTSPALTTATSLTSTVVFSSAVPVDMSTTVNATVESTPVTSSPSTEAVTFTTVPTATPQTDPPENATAKALVNDSRGMPTGVIALLSMITFAVITVVGYVGLIVWRRYLEYRYGNRELLVNDLEFDTNDLRHFEL